MAFGERACEIGLQHSSGGESVKKNLVATVTLSTPKAPEAFASEIAAVILQKDTSAHYYDQLTVQIYYGYDIGIAQRWSHQEFSRTTLEWETSPDSVPQRGRP